MSWCALLAALSTALACVRAQDVVTQQTIQNEVVAPPQNAVPQQLQPPEAALSVTAYPPVIRGYTVTPPPNFVWGPLAPMERLNVSPLLSLVYTPKDHRVPVFSYTPTPDMQHKLVEIHEDIISDATTAAYKEAPSPVPAPVRVQKKAVYQAMRFRLRLMA